MPHSRSITSAALRGRASRSRLQQLHHQPVERFAAARARRRGDRAGGTAPEVAQLLERCAPDRRGGRSACSTRARRARTDRRARRAPAAAAPRAARTAACRRRPWRRPSAPSRRSRSAWRARRAVQRTLRADTSRCSSLRECRIASDDATSRSSAQASRHGSRPRSRRSCAVEQLHRVVRRRRRRRRSRRPR